MKTLLLVAIVVGVGGWFAYAKVLKPAPKRACDRIAELCGDSGRKSDDKSCGEFFDELKKTGGEDTDKTAQCVLEAKGCAEAIGCTAGGAIKIGAGAAKGFLEGLQKSVK